MSQSWICFPSARLPPTTTTAATASDPSTAAPRPYPSDVRVCVFVGACRVEDARSAIVFSAFSRRRFCDKDDCLKVMKHKTVAGVHGNQDLNRCVKIGILYGFWRLSWVRIIYNICPPGNY